MKVIAWLDFEHAYNFQVQYIYYFGLGLYEISVS